MRPISINKLPFLIGLRYSFSRRRNRFIGIVSMVSLIGMALGVASLIVVLSVMNGFADELRNRILSVVPHASVQARDGLVTDWRALGESLQRAEGVIASAPYASAKVLLDGSRYVQGAQLLAVDVGREPRVSRVASSITLGSFEALAEGRWHIVLGTLLARSLGVTVGDSVELTAPVLTHTPLGSMPRRKRFEVVGLFEVGAQLDGTHALINLPDGQVLLGMGEGVSGLRLAYTDLFAAPAISEQLSKRLPADLQILSCRAIYRAAPSGLGERARCPRVALCLPWAFM